MNTLFSVLATIGLATAPTTPGETLTRARETEIAVTAISRSAAAMEGIPSLRIKIPGRIANPLDNPKVLEELAKRPADFANIQKLLKDREYHNCGIYILATKGIDHDIKKELLTYCINQMVEYGDDKEHRQTLDLCGLFHDLDLYENTLEHLYKVYTAINDEPKMEETFALLEEVKAQKASRNQQVTVVAKQSSWCCCC